ncbi:hypothetical protein [Streptomyces sp. NPDC054837]
MQDVDATAVMAIKVRTPRISGVWRACGLVNSVTCSANVTVGQTSLRQRNRRTSTSMTTRVPLTAASDVRRWWRPCTRPDLR